MSRAPRFLPTDSSSGGHSGSAGCPLPPWSPLLNGRKRVAGPSRRVVILTSLLLTAKWTSAPLGKVSSGSAFWPFGLGWRSKRYWSIGVLNALREVRLQFDRRDRQAVEEQNEVERVLVRRRVTHLPDDAQTVGGVARQNVGVHRQRRLELRQREGCRRPIISTPCRSTSSVPRSSSCLRMRSSSTPSAAAPWFLVSVSHALGCVASIQAMRSGGKSARARS